MSTQIAHADRPEASKPNVAGYLAADLDRLYPEHPLGIARGIFNGVLISIPLWALFGVVIYLLV